MADNVESHLQQCWGMIAATNGLLGFMFATKLTSSQSGLPKNTVGLQLSGVLVTVACFSSVLLFRDFQTEAPWGYLCQCLLPRPWGRAAGRGSGNRWHEPRAEKGALLVVVCVVVDLWQMLPYRGMATQSLAPHDSSR